MRESVVSSGRATLVRTFVDGYDSSVALCFRSQLQEQHEPEACEDQAAAAASIAGTAASRLGGTLLRHCDAFVVRNGTGGDCWLTRLFHLGNGYRNLSSSIDIGISISIVVVLAAAAASDLAFGLDSSIGLFSPHPNHGGRLWLLMQRDTLSWAEVPAGGIHP